MGVIAGGLGRHVDGVSCFLLTNKIDCKFNCIKDVNKYIQLCFM